VGWATEGGEMTDITVALCAVAVVVLVAVLVDLVRHR
jgi:hypothetical protein